MKQKKIILEPIGLVKNSVEKRRNDLRWKDVKSKIILAPKFEEAIEGIEEYSHIMIVFWMARTTKKSCMVKKRIPYGFKEVSPVGVLATRMPERPNPIGVSIVELIGRKRNVLEVSGLDAFNNSPVLDIKPYTGHPRDLVYDFRVPEWEKRINKR